MSMMMDIRKLSVFNKMAKEGGDRVSDQLTQMTGIETEIKITKINFLDIEDLKTHLGEEEKIGVQIELLSKPHGHVLILFDEDSAKTVTDGMLQGMGERNDGFGQMEQSAVQEISNIMTSGFIDGWANVLETTIEIGTPTFFHKLPRKFLEEIKLSDKEGLAMFFDSRVVTPESNDSEIEAEIYVFPELDELVTMMNEFDLNED